MGSTISLVLSICGIIGLVGGAVGYFAKARGDSIIEYLTKENVAIKEYNQTLEKENVSLRASAAAKDHQIATLTTLAQGSPQLVKLTKAVAGSTNQMARLADKVAAFLTKEDRK